MYLARPNANQVNRYANERIKIESNLQCCHVLLFNYFTKIQKYHMTYKSKKKQINRIIIYKECVRTIFIEYVIRNMYR